jgi:chitodextrinase
MGIVLLVASLFSSTTPVSASNSSFVLRGASVSANCLVSSSDSYYPNGWQLLKDAGVNWIRVSGGTEGDVNHFNVLNYPNEWATNLENFLEQANSYGIKVSFCAMGSPYDTLFGIRYPGCVGNDAFGAVSYSYTPVEQAKAIIDQLAGNNSLHHNFISDPRVLGWVTSNEVYIGPETNSNPDYDGPFILQWNLQLLDYIHSKGGKAWMASPTTIRGTSEGYDFANVLPLIGSHVDYLEAHYYEEVALINDFRKTDGTYDWVAFESYYKNLLQTEMISSRGAFSLDKVLLGEFGMWVGQGNDFGLNASFSSADRKNYYQAVLDAAKAVGLRNICQFDFFQQADITLNEFGIVSLAAKDFFANEAADLLRTAYGAVSVSLSVDSSTFTAGSSVTLQGNIFPIQSNAQVTVSVKSTGNGWTNLATVTADSSGAYSYVWRNVTAGSYSLKASLHDPSIGDVDSNVLLVYVASSNVSKGVPVTTASFEGQTGQNGWFLSDVTVNLSAVSNVSEIDKIKYSFDNSSWVTYTGPFQVTHAGANTLYYGATDKAGNVEPTKNVTLKIDKTPPTAIITGNRTLRVNESISLSGGSSTDDVGVVSFAWDFGDGATAQGKTTAHTYSKDGIYNVSLTVTDAAGNIGYLTIPISVNVSTGGETNWVPIVLVATIVPVVAVVVAVFIFKWYRKRNAFKM